MMMGVKTNPLKQVFLLFLLFALVHPIFAQETGNVTAQVTENITSIRPVLTENQNPTYSQEDILRDSQKSFERSISILNTVATSMGVLVGLLTLILLIAAAGGIFEYKNWISLRKGIDKRANELEAKIKRVEVDAKVVRDLRKNVEEDVSKLGEEIKNQIPSLTETPSKDFEEKLDEFSRKIEVLEMLGGSLTDEEYFNRGVDLYYKEKYELALTAFEKAIGLEPDYADTWYNKGLTLGRLGRHTDALTAYEKAIGLKPDYADAWDGKGVALGRLDRHKDALTAFEKAIGLEPDYAGTWYNKGNALGRLDRHKDALPAYEKAIELKPDYADAWDGKGVALGRLDRHKDALTAYEKAIELNPDYAGTWYNKGVALGRLDRHKDALPAYEKVIELKPDYADAWNSKGYTLNKLGRLGDALTAYEKAIELEPNHPGAWYNKACAYSLKGDKENTLTNLSKAIGLDDKHKEMAKKDEDFKEFWDDEDFKKIVSKKK